MFLVTCTAQRQDSEGKGTAPAPACWVLVCLGMSPAKHDPPTSWHPRLSPQPFYPERQRETGGGGGKWVGFTYCSCNCPFLQRSAIGTALCCCASASSAPGCSSDTSVLKCRKDQVLLREPGGMKKLKHKSICSIPDYGHASS